MKLRILSIGEQGNANKEHVWLEAKQDCDLKFYGLADTTYTSSNSISNKLRHFFWFPPKAVKKGELVLLRTKTGTNGKYTASDGRTVHRFYWNLKSAVWNNDGDAAVLFEMRSWDTKRA